MEKKYKLAVGIVAAVVILAVVLFLTRSKESLVIVNGVEYRLLSYGKAEPQLNDGTSLEAYVLTVTYEDPTKGLTRGTIMVPASGIFTDPSLPTNTVVWDKPIQLEGKYYAQARWNPGFMIPARERPPLVPEDPLTTKD